VGALCGVFGLLLLILLKKSPEPVVEPSAIPAAEARTIDSEADPLATADDSAIVPEAVPEIASGDDQPVAEEVANAGACAEVAKQFPDVHVTYANDEINDDRCALTLQFLGPTVPVLPNLAGYEIPNVPRSPRVGLFEEADNPEWSRAMESRILQEIPTLLDFPLITVHAVCRSETCGLLFAYTNDVYAGGRRNEFARRLAETLGFSGYVSGESQPPRRGSSFTYMYLGDWNMTSAEIDGPPRSLPTRFEDITGNVPAQSGEGSP